MSKNRFVFTLLMLCLYQVCCVFQPVMHFETYDCSNDYGNYTEGSIYQQNLNHLLSSFSSQTSSQRFHNSTFGNFPNKVYGLYQCREGMILEICGECIKEATLKLTKGCHLFVEGIVWYDECMLRYANRSIFSLSEASPSSAGYYEEKVTNYNKLRPIVENKMSTVIDHAARTTDQKHFASAYANWTATDKVYFFAQCTPDIDEFDCKSCLKIGLANMYTNTNYNGSQGVTVFYPSCQLGYDTVLSLLSYLLPPPGSAPSGLASAPAPIIVKRQNNYNAGNRKVSSKVIIAIVISVVTVSAVLLALGLCFITKGPLKYKDIPIGSGEDIIILESLHYDVVTLQSATNNFSKENKLGEGGFGSVYKGTLSNGEEIAVKRLAKGSFQGVQQFQNEVLLVAKLQHRNLVRLLGFCLHGEEKLLVYEYVANKSLDFFLFDQDKKGYLNWETRYKIIVGIARGMLYLHKDSRLKIIHRDLKASNILLDDEMNPKVSDFGMARIFNMDQSRATTSIVVGTYGYMAPEYAMRGQFSDKSDVYSFGVLILEIICGQRNSSFYETSDFEELLSYAWKKWRDGKPLDFVDSTIRESCSSNEVLRCMHLGLLCVQEVINKRPTMETVVVVLHSDTYTLAVPEEPLFYTKSTKESNLLRGVSSYQFNGKSMPSSINDVSVTEVAPR